MLSDISLARLASVHPELARRVKNVADELDTEGTTIQVNQGLRTSAQQTILYAQGRTLPGTKVTNAQGCQSNHVIGCAVDVEPVEGITETPDWNATHPSWQRIVAVATKHKLRDGKSWHDLPHLELEEIPTEPTPEIQELMAKSGLQAVWDKLAISEVSA